MLFNHQLINLLSKVAHNCRTLVIPSMILFSLSSSSMEKDENIIHVCSNGSLYASDAEDPSQTKPPQYASLPSTKLEGDDTVFYPTEENREKFLENEGLILDHREIQSGTDEKIQPIFGLSIDGGGIRGIMPAIWLQMLRDELKGDKTDNKEEAFDGSLSKVFDYVGGRSIGGILALGIAEGLEVDTLVGLFKEKAGEVFPRSWKVKLQSLGGLIGPRYSAVTFEKLLKKNFGDKTFVETSSNVLVTACTMTGKPKLLKSFSEDDRGHKLWEIARCTLAAPTYFPAYNLKNHTNHTDSFVDGGMWINNPSTLVASSMVKDLHGGKFSPNNIYMLSLGTGDMSLQTMLPNNAGITSAKSIIDILMNSNSQGNHETMQSFLGNNYYRINSWPLTEY